MIRNVRLTTGLILFAFVISHLINLAFGLKSIAVMDMIRPWIILPWTNIVGGLVLAFSLLIHSGLGLYALYRRNTLRLNKFDAGQLIFGLSIPLFLMPHVLPMLNVPILGDTRKGYADMMTYYWIDNLWQGLFQVIGLVLVWVHACMGLFVWMRLHRWWPRLASAVYLIVVLVPVLALLGFAEAGKERLIAEAAGASSTYSSSYGIDDYSSSYGSDYSSSYGSDYGDSSASDTAAELDAAHNKRNDLMKRVGASMYVGTILLIMIARIIRARRQSAGVLVKYASGEEVNAESGHSILEISRLNDVPHGSLCGGKARCGTCRVRIHEGAEHLSPIEALEAKKLHELGDEPGVRLACQARLSGGRVVLERLLPAYVQPDDLHAQASSGVDDIQAEPS